MSSPGHKNRTRKTEPNRTKNIRNFRFWILLNNRMVLFSTIHGYQLLTEPNRYPWISIL
ncbi:unnamed protein product, partial [Arabidopsis halleri]